MTLTKYVTYNIETFIEDLLNESAIDQLGVSRALAIAEAEDISLDRAILKLGLVDEELLIPRLAKSAGCKQIADIPEYTPDLVSLDLLTFSYCQSNQIVPISDANGRSFILSSDPANGALGAELLFFLERPPAVVAAPTRIIRSLLASLDETQEDTKVSGERLQADQEALRQGEFEGPVIRFVSEILNEAVAVGASDVHFEAQEDGLRIRLRINGILQAHPVNRSLSVVSILARLKVISGMNVSERRLPQDGRITSTIAGRKVDFRVSSVPTSFGESIVCRVLDPNALRLGWGKLGFDAETTRQIIEIIEQPNGLFLVTGPTGSGKTTTLYTALAHLNDEGRKILTVEDPIEYNLAGVEQVQVHEEIGLTFARTLRSFLRQDPNVLMVGEIRDEETAEIACRAAMVGRMVLSTLHTNTPEGAVTRLTNLGVPEYVVKAVLRGVLGQRLEISGGGVRRLQAKLAL
ncbi:GspE/PulE family protein [Ruegeria atlantica]|uniref:GspE/PulE family protein n=1 Tax=Ruegeria atlantica TaxID=81569 RepID=UPI00147DF63A|nr:GspE/PulE family protein [Ruegeria atlantica]